MSVFTPKRIEDVPVVMTQNEVASLLRVDVRTIKRWRKNKPDFPEGIVASSRLILFRKEEILNWLEKRKSNGSDS